MDNADETAAAQSGTRFLVSGRVQRVGFRAATRRRALRLGLRGHARNLRDGRVEVIVTGAPDCVRALREWLQQGPALARVDRVEETGECALAAVDGFTTS